MGKSSAMSSQKWVPTMGLEIHAQLKTSSKIFSSDSAKFGEGDNFAVSPLSLGLPGSLPVPNKKVIEFAIQAGLAFQCRISKKSYFARKNYFYPDMPRGYQISQFEQPICSGGYVSFFFDGKSQKIELERIHMEEDAGKSTHYGDYSLINLNRSGVPLLEIVSQPVLKSASQAAAYSRSVRQVLRYLDICDGNLEEGSLRVDCNISIAPLNSSKLGTKVELKNLNSFRFIEKALEYEFQRQVDTVESGGLIEQETRLYDSVKNITVSMRKKEDSKDYRYFPDPDLLPCAVTEKTIETLKKAQPELPNEKRERYLKDYGLNEDEIAILIEERELADFFEDVATQSQNPKMASNWIRGEFLAAQKEKPVGMAPADIMPSNWIAKIILLVKKGEISGKTGKEIFWKSLKTNTSPEKILIQEGLSQIQDESIIEKAVDEVLKNSPEQVTEYKSGKTKVFGYFVGQVMKSLKGRANPSQVNEILVKKLER